MSEHKEPIPSMIYNAAVGGHVTNSQQIIDENENKEQSKINAEVKQILGQGGSVDSRIAAAVNIEKTRAQAAEQLLQEQYNALTQSDVVVGTLPESGTKNLIYRVPGTSSYFDYMWNGTQFIKMAEYDNAIDDEPIAGSDNLVKSGGVAYTTLYGTLKYSLYQGLLNSDGSVSFISTRVTTKAIKAPSSKIYVSCKDGFAIHCRTGNAPNNLSTDLGYVGYPNKPAIIETTDAYIGLTFVYNGTSITPSSLKELIITDYNSQIAIADRERRENKRQTDINIVKNGSSEPFFPFIQGSRTEYGDSAANGYSISISSKIVPIEGKYKVVCDSNHIMAVKYRQKGSLVFTEVATWVQSYTIEGSGEMSVMIRNNAMTDINTSENTGFAIYYESISPYIWTMIGQEEESRWNANYVLRKGVTYIFSFESDNFSVSSGVESAFSLYVIRSNRSTGTNDRINIYSSGTTIPSKKVFTFDDDYLLQGISRLVVGSYVKITIEPHMALSNLFTKTKKEIEETQAFREYLIADMFTKGNTISDIKNKFAVTCGSDINSDGLVCVAYTASTDSNEVVMGATDTRLSICNLADIEGTKKDYPAIIVGELYNDGNLLAGSSQWAHASWTSDDEITVICELVTTIDGTRNTGIVSRKFKPSTETWGDIIFCDITVPGVTNPIEMIDNKETIEEIWSATGIEHPAGRGGVDNYAFMTSNPQPVKYEGYFYLPICCGNYSHPLLRTTDMVHFEFVCDIPYSDGQHGIYSPSEEVSICFYNNRIYAVTRGNNGYLPGHPNDGWNTILYCDIDKISQDADTNRANWHPFVLTGYAFERPSIVAMGGMIITYQGIIPNYLGLDGKIQSRGRHAIVIYDINLNILRKCVLSSKIAWQHPIFINNNNQLISIVSTDLRGFGNGFDGDCRAELQVVRLDPELLYMVCK